VEASHVLELPDLKARVFLVLIAPLSHGGFPSTPTRCLVKSL
jgi:hypothetical protein